MPGPWFLPLIDPEYLKFFVLEVGEIVEVGVLDDNGVDQGTVLLGVSEVQETSKHGIDFSASYLGASDEYYRHWMSDG
eukprot:1355414-Amphidinium_carterae.1